MNTKVLPSGEACMSGIEVVKGFNAKNFNIKKTPLEISEGSILKKSTKEGIVPEILGMILS
jgi:hypothetical protein